MYASLAPPPSSWKREYPDSTYMSLKYHAHRFPKSFHVHVAANKVANGVSVLLACS